MPSASIRRRLGYLELTRNQYASVPRLCAPAVTIHKFGIMLFSYLQKLMPTFFTVGKIIVFRFAIQLMRFIVNLLNN